MPRHKKKFIDKKNAITYQLIHRSQKDPLQANEDASKMVLVTGDELEDAQRKERLTTHGIYYDDDYDYEQHLRDVDDMNKMEPDRDVEELFRVGSSAKSKAVLPEEVLPSRHEEEIGMLELAAPVSGPRVDWDPEIVAALDSDNDEPMDEDFDDDFVALANESGDDEDWEDEPTKLGDRQKQWIQDQMIGGATAFDSNSKVFSHSKLHSHTEERDEDDMSSNFSGEEDDDEVGSLQSFSDDDNKTRFTNYSMSSSVIRRNQGLTLIDDKFEQLFATYDEEEIGALDHEDIDGKVSTTGPMMEYLLEQFKKQQVKEPLLEPLDQKDTIEIVSDVESSDDEPEELTKIVVDGETNKWDCESILSTYSNLYNHPKVIEEPWKKSKRIELTKKLGIPKESIQPRGLTRKQLQELEREQAGDDCDIIKGAPVRRKGETAEEKKLRKSQVKEERKERRVEKKNTKLAFRHEAASQKKQQISQANTLGGQKLI